MLELSGNGSTLARGCDDVTGPSDVPTTDVERQLQSLQKTGGELVVIGQPESFTLELRENGELSVQADCNGCFGSYELLPGNQIRINEPMACTAAFCPLSAPLDTEYVALLAASTSYEATQTELTLFSDQGTLRFGR